jgi:hypothetical protein
MAARRASSLLFAALFSGKRSTMRSILLLATLGCIVALPLRTTAQAPVVGDQLTAPTPGVPLLVTESPGTCGTFDVDVDYVLWWLREGRVPALLTTSSPASRGFLGQSDTRILYGDDRIATRHDDQFNGIRFALGWMNADGNFGVEARAFFLERDSTNLTTSSDGSVLLAVPYFNAVTGRPDSRIVAGLDPTRGLLSGGFNGYTRIEWFGEEVNAVIPVSAGDGWRLALLAGARFLQMRDRFHETNTSRSVADGGAQLWGLTDNIRVGNAYYGGQVGVSGESTFGRFFVQVRGTIGIGGDDELVRAFGGKSYQTPTTSITAPTGLFVQQSNTGSFSRCNFDGVGEAAINLGYQLASWVRLKVGYTFLYWADPLRAGEQVDTVVNHGQTTHPTPAVPVIPFKGDALWAQGVNAGVELRW